MAPMPYRLGTQPCYDIVSYMNHPLYMRIIYNAAGHWEFMAQGYDSIGKSDGFVIYDRL